MSEELESIAQTLDRHGYAMSAAFRGEWDTVIQFIAKWNLTEIPQVGINRSMAYQRLLALAKANIVEGTCPKCGVVGPPGECEQLTLGGERCPGRIG